MDGCSAEQAVTLEEGVQRPVVRRCRLQPCLDGCPRRVEGRREIAAGVHRELARDLALTTPSGRVDMGQEIRKLDVVDAVEQEIWHHRRKPENSACGTWAL